MTLALSLREAASHFLLYNRYNNVIHAWPGFAQGARGKTPWIAFAGRVDAY